MEKHRDTVCGMEVGEGEAAGQSVYQGQTYYFCSTSCKERFDAHPEEFTDK